MDDIKQEVVENCKREIGRAEYYKGFYKFYEDLTKDKKAKAKIALKRKQIEDSLEKNTIMLKQLEEYNKTV